MPQTTTGLIALLEDFHATPLYCSTVGSRPAYGDYRVSAAVDGAETYRFRGRRISANGKVRQKERNQRRRGHDGESADGQWKVPAPWAHRGDRHLQTDFHHG